MEPSYEGDQEKPIRALLPRAGVIFSEDDGNPLLELIAHS